MSPIPQADGHDAPRLFGELVPALAAVGNDVVVGFEDAVGEPVVAHELPDVLDRVELGRAGRQRQKGDVVGDAEAGRDMPSCLVEDHHRMGAGIDGGADLGEMRRHRLGVGIGHDQPRTLAEPRADGPEDVGPFGALIVRRAGTGAAPRPAPSDQVLLADAGFVLEPDLDPLAAGVPLADLRHRGGEVFLNASMASGSWP